MTRQAVQYWIAETLLRVYCFRTTIGRHSSRDGHPVEIRAEATDFLLKGALPSSTAIFKR